MSKLIKTSSIDQTGALHVVFTPDSLARLQKCAAAEGEKDGAAWLARVVESCIAASMGDDKP